LEEFSMPDAIQHDRVNMTEAEWQARCDLAALYRITDHLGWTDTIDTHMTVRIPGEPNAFLINNYGDLFHEITASSLVKMDIDGNVCDVAKMGRASNPSYGPIFQLTRAPTSFHSARHSFRSSADN